MKTRGAKLSLVIAAIWAFSVCGCAFSKAQTQIDDSTFQERYLFKSEGQLITTSPVGPFFEAGIVIADGQGHYTVISTENASGQLPQNGTVQGGTYTLNAQGAGTMRTPADSANFYVSADGSHAYVISTESYATWLVELTRE